MGTHQHQQPNGVAARLGLLPGWQARLEEAERRLSRPAPIRSVLPRSPRHYSGVVTPVGNISAARSMFDLARQRALSYIGFDTEFCYDRPGVWVNTIKGWAYDPSSVRPLLLSLAMVEPGDGGALTSYPFVIDLRVPSVLEVVAALLRLPLCFVGHYAHAELICLFKLGLPEPSLLWDTWVHEKAMRLGRGHKNYRAKADADDAEQARAAEEAAEESEFSCSLVASCQRHGVVHPFAGDKERLQRSFLDHPADAPFSQEQVEYAAADAVAAAALYPLQVAAATRAGILQHLVSVEMPWVVTNARMVFRGVRKDGDLCRRVEHASRKHLDTLGSRLAGYGITSADSFPQLKAFFEAQGILGLFRRGGKVSFDKEMLEEFQDRHPAIPLLRAARRINTLLESRVLTDEFVGIDGRVHPNYTQLGTHTGRQTSWGPNILGLGRVFRPLIVPGPGRGIGEVDLSQIEVGIAGAVYHDDHLIELFNTGDVYSAMALLFYGKELPEADRSMPTTQFKSKHPSLRSRMKACTLGIIYGLTAHGLALRLNVSESQAAALMGRFMDMFPDLKKALAETPECGALCGYVSDVSGLRRYRDQPVGALTAWERNWMANHKVQASAATAFKAAGNRLDRLYRAYDACLVIPMHDAYVFEAPLDVLPAVADLAGRVLCESVQEYFPCLRPRVEINIGHPECWNKDGHADSLERWLDDPTYTFS